MDVSRARRHVWRVSVAVVVLALTLSSTSSGPAACASLRAPEFRGEARPGSDASYAVVLRDSDHCTWAWLDTVFGRLMVPDGALEARTSSVVSLRFESEPGLRLYLEDEHGRVAWSTLISVVGFFRGRAVGPEPGSDLGKPYMRWSIYRAVVEGPGVAAVPAGRHRVAVARDDEVLHEVPVPLDVDGPLVVAATVARHPTARPLSAVLLGTGIIAAVVGGAWASTLATDHELSDSAPQRVGAYTMVGGGALGAAVGIFLYTQVFEETVTLEVRRE